MHKQRPERKWVRTWATSHHALSREKVSAQLRNNSIHVREQDKSIMYDNQINQSINYKVTYVGSPAKPVIILSESIL